MIDVQKQLEWLYGLERFGVKPGLERMERMMELSGHPERKFKTIHISGTNGKGSVAAMVDSVLRADENPHPSPLPVRQLAEERGTRVGLYTSPHLSRFNERIRVDGKEISDEDLARLVESLRTLVEEHDIPATFFEFTTAIALMYFAERDVDIAVVEVGMGGLLDATNVVEPLVSVITNIGLDHTEYLGDTKEKITHEKAGIIKHGAPVVTTEGDETLLAIMRERAGESGSELYEADSLLSPTSLKLPSLRTRLRRARRGAGSTVLPSSGGDFLRRQKIAVSGEFTGEFHLPLLGAHQVDNAMCVLAVVYVLNQFGYGISWNDIQRGLERVVWPGRLDVVSRYPLILVDGAHNNDGVEALYMFVKDLSRHDVLVLGEKLGKNMGVMAEKVVPLFDRVIVTKGVYMPEEPQVIADALRDSGYAGEIEIIDSAREAVAKGREYVTELSSSSQNAEPVLLISGSLYLVGDALAKLRQA